MALAAEQLWHPASSETEVLHPAVWRIQSLVNLLDEIHGLDIYHARTGRQLLFRGQRDSTWGVNSTFWRFASSHKQFNAFDGNEFHFRAIEYFLEFHQRICQVNQDFVQRCSDEELDYLFEVHCRIQQDNSLFDPRIGETGTLITDWTVDPRIGLFFSIREQDLRNPIPAALFTYDPYALNFFSDSVSLLDELSEDLAKQEIRSDTVVICPPRQISYLRKQVQKARYVSQQNLSRSMDSLWNDVLESHERPGYQFHLKIEIPAHVIEPLKQWLSNQDFEERRLFPEEADQ